MARGDGLGFLVVIGAALLFLGVGAKKVKQGRGVRASKGKYDWTDHDMRTFISELEPLGVPLADSLLVYTSESGLDPQASSGIAFGICQLTQIAAKEIGWTRPLREFGTLSVYQQAPWIAKLQASQIRMIGYTPKTALELYVANLSPKAAAARSDVIYVQGTKNYAKNANLDRDKKGYISASDLDRSLNGARQSPIYLAAIEHLKRMKESS